MKDPKVGDTVAVYCYSTRRVGVLSEVIGDAVHVRYPGEDYDCWAHEKQCRRIVKKKRREFWINIDADNSQLAYNSLKEAIENRSSDWVECVRVVEVKEKK